MTQKLKLYQNHADVMINLSLIIVYSQAYIAAPGLILWVKVKLS